MSQQKPLQFADESIVAGIGPASRGALTFGVLFFDYDLDGRLDLLTANGHIEDEINKVQASQQYAQAPHLFWNAGSAACGLRSGPASRERRSRATDGRARERVRGHR